jgi:hypothetical protein
LKGRSVFLTTEGTEGTEAGWLCWLLVSRETAKGKARLEVTGVTMNTER